LKILHKFVYGTKCELEKPNEENCVKFGGGGIQSTVTDIAYGVE